MYEYNDHTEVGEGRFSHNAFMQQLLANNSNDNATTDSVCKGFHRDSVNYGGLAGVIIFYTLILAIGMYASWKKRDLYNSADVKSDDVMLASRDIGAFVGIFTMTATWVGGGYISGTAEYVYTGGYGLAWTQAPWGYAIALILGGLFYAEPMRKKRYVTMLDPFEQRYGPAIAALCYIPALLGEIFWSGAILSALGASLTVIVGLERAYAVIISAAFAVIYTLFGGLYSVAYTDVVQLVCIAVGLIVTIPFALNHPAVSNIWDVAVLKNNENTGWVGQLEPKWVGNWLDSACLLMFGGIGWQVYFQRVLSARTPFHAQLLSYLAAVGAFLMALPPIFIGAIARATDWNATDYPEGGVIQAPDKDGYVALCTEDNSLVLPLVMQYLTPTWVAVIGLGAVSAAVMSSADSSVLSCSCMFAKNIYTPWRNVLTKGRLEPAGDREVLWVMRVGIVLAGVAASVMAIVVESIYALWFLCGDLVYVILFPQLTCAIFLPFANTYGALLGWIVGMVMRLTGGESLLNLPPAIKYPHYDEEAKAQMTPFKTMAMLECLITIILVSYITQLLFTKKHLDIKYDVFYCFHDRDPENSKLFVFDMNTAAADAGKTRTVTPTMEIDLGPDNNDMTKFDNQSNNNEATDTKPAMNGRGASADGWISIN